MHVQCPKPQLQQFVQWIWRTSPHKYVNQSDNVDEFYRQIELSVTSVLDALVPLKNHIHYKWQSITKYLHTTCTFILTLSDVHFLMPLLRRPSHGKLQCLSRHFLMTLAGIPQLTVYHPPDATASYNAVYISMPEVQLHISQPFIFTVWLRNSQYFQ